MLSVTRPSGTIRTIVLAFLAATSLAAGSGIATARGPRGDSYGINGGVSRSLAVANVYSGIYGLDYIFNRPYPGDPGVADPVRPCVPTGQKRRGNRTVDVCE